VEIRRSARAEQDLIEIWNYIAQHDEAAADRVFDRLVAKSELIGRNPGIGRPRPDIGGGVRSALADSWAVYYRLQPDHVEILRYLHTRRRIPEIS
jgi:toxin ParE1/3/4